MKPIAITLGDPAGIGAEVVFKAIAELDLALPILLFGDWNYAAQSPGFRKLSRLDSAGDATRGFVDLKLSDSKPVHFGQVLEKYGRVSLASIEAAASAVENGICSGLVTAPIHKQAIAAAGATVPGHTELLAARSGLKRYGHDFAMYFDSPSLRVALLSVHIPLREVAKQLDAFSVAALTALTRREVQRLHGIDPRIAVAAINPHASGDEEKILAAGVARAREEGARVSGPHPADTVFLSARRGIFDVVIAAYHDQGLIPIKTLEFDRSVNVTLGLPYLRCSVDHGTAFDIAGKGVADQAPMRYAIDWAARHVEKFAR